MHSCYLSIFYRADDVDVKANGPVIGLALAGANLVVGLTWPPARSSLATRSGCGRHTQSATSLAAAAASRRSAVRIHLGAASGGLAGRLGLRRSWRGPRAGVHPAAR